MITLNLASGYGRALRVSLRTSITFAELTVCYVLYPVRLAHQMTDIAKLSVLEDAGLLLALTGQVRIHSPVYHHNCALT